MVLWCFFFCVLLFFVGNVHRNPNISQIKLKIGTWFELESTVQRFASATLNESPKWFYLSEHPSETKGRNPSQRTRLNGSAAFVCVLFLHGHKWTYSRAFVLVHSCFHGPLSFSIGQGDGPPLHGPLI